MNTINNTNHKVYFGIIGGMGFEADEFFQKNLRKKTRSLRDQEGIPTIVVKNSNIPDRSSFILNGGEDPVPEMVNSAKILENAGCVFSAIACNTAHYFLDRVRKETNMIILNMLKIVSEHIAENYTNFKVGILGTNVTVNLGLYDKFFKERNMELVKLNQKDQEKYVNAAILGRQDEEEHKRIPTGLKAGEYKNSTVLISKAVEKMKDQGVKVVMLACTELPIVQEQLEENFPDTIFLDPVVILCEKIVQISRKAEKLLEDKVNPSYEEKLAIIKSLI